MPQAPKAPASRTSAPLSGPPGYETWLASLKRRIASSRVQAAVSANRELVLLYWDIGKEIFTRQERQGYGTRVVDRLAADLTSAFPSMKGFSIRNLKYMRAFAAAWPDREVVQTLSAQLSWSHNVALSDKVQAAQDREWYARSAIEHGWSLNALVHQIDSGLVDRSGTVISNFKATREKSSSCCVGLSSRFRSPSSPITAEVDFCRIQSR